MVILTREIMDDTIQKLNSLLTPKHFCTLHINPKNYLVYLATIHDGTKRLQIGFDSSEEMFYPGTTQFLL